MQVEIQHSLVTVGKTPPCKIRAHSGWQYQHRLDPEDAVLQAGPGARSASRRSPDEDGLAADDRANMDATPSVNPPSRALTAAAPFSAPVNALTPAQSQARVGDKLQY